MKGCFNSFCFKFFRTLFGLYIIYFGLFQLHNIDALEKSVPETVRQFEAQVLIPREIKLDLGSFIQYARELVQFYVLNIILAGALILFGFRIGKFFLTITIVLDLIYIHNWAHYKGDLAHIAEASKLVAILGGSFCL
jgi:hypothetical protein